MKRANNKKEKPPHLKAERFSPWIYINLFINFHHYPEASFPCSVIGVLCTEHEIILVEQCHFITRWMVVALVNHYWVNNVTWFCSLQNEENISLGVLGSKVEREWT